jgi:hypothetical protein
MPDVFGDVAAWGSRYPNHDTGTVEEARGMLGRWGVGDDVAAKYLRRVRRGISGWIDRLYILRSMVVLPGPGRL